MTPLAQSPAASLLLASARLAADSESGGRMAMESAEGQACVDWDDLLAMAAAHGMRPLLYRFLLGAHRFQRAGIAGRPNSFQSASRQASTLEAMRAQESTLQDFTQRNLRKNLRLTGELILLLRLFAERGVSVIPFKGPTLAALAYGDLGLREFVDLDLLIARRDFMKAQELLVVLGYQPEVLLRGRQAESFNRSCNVMAFWHAEKEISVELHWELSPKYLPFSPDFESLRERMIASYPGGQMVMTLSPEDLLVYLCAHGAKHVWERLIWIADVAGLIHRQSNMDWDRVLDLAAGQRCERVLMLGLRLARDLTGVTLPARIEELVRTDPDSERLAAKVTRWLLRDSGATPGLVELSIFIFELQSRWPDKIRSFARLVATPSAADWMAFPGLQQFTGLYSLLRPLRLMSKLVRGG